MHIVFFSTRGDGAAAAAWVPHSKRPPLRGQGCGASKSVLEHAAEFSSQSSVLVALAIGESQLSQGDFLHPWPTARPQRSG